MIEKMITYAYEDVYLRILVDENELWLTRPQLMLLFSCTEAKLQLMIQNIRRLYPSLYPATMRKIPLIIQEKGAYTKQLHETVRPIQHFNYKMIKMLLTLKVSVIAQDYLRWSLKQSMK